MLPEIHPASTVPYSGDALMPPPVEPETSPLPATIEDEPAQAPPRTTRPPRRLVPFQPPRPAREPAVPAELQTALDPPVRASPPVAVAALAAVLPVYSADAAAAAAAAAGPDRAEVVAAMESIRDAVVTCAAGKTGLARVQVTVQSSGRVASALVSGHGFVGTPEGSCIARAVRGATFTPFTRDSTRITYPFQL
jgi:hypothetical protein